MTRAILLVFALAGCGGAQIATETARIGACQAVEEIIERKYAAGDMSQQRAFDRIDAVRDVCDALHARIVPEGDQ